MADGVQGEGGKDRELTVSNDKDMERNDVVMRLADCGSGPGRGRVTLLRPYRQKAKDVLWVPCPFL